MSTTRSLKNIKLETTVVIPIYNELPTIIPIVTVLLSVFSPERIIIIDDHSTDGAKTRLKELNKELRVLQNKNKRGKMNAVRYALSYISTRYTLLLDGDLDGFDRYDIDSLLSAFANSADNSMLISYRKDGRFHEHNIVFVDPSLNGERMLLTSILKEVLNNKLYQGYELEMILNKYFLDNKMPIHIVPLDISQRAKKNKRGLWRGLYQDVQMGFALVIVFGLIEVVRQMVLISFRFQVDNKREKIEKKIKDRFE